MSTEINNPCECTRCASALSPAGYLISLLEFIELYFGKDIQYLFSQRMHRPELINQDLEYQMIEEPIPQIEIAINVLIEYIRKKIDPTDARGLTDEDIFQLLADSNNPPPFFHEGTRFKEYLTVLGTSLEDIHTAFIDPDATTFTSQFLAECLRISHPEFQDLINNRDDTDYNRDDTARILGISRTELNDALGSPQDKDNLAKYLGLKIEEFDQLRNLAIIGGTAPIPYSEFDKLRRISTLARALGITVNDIKALIDLLNRADLLKDDIESIYRALLIGNDLGLSGTHLSNFVQDLSDVELVIHLNHNPSDPANPLDELKVVPVPVKLLSRAFRISEEEIDVIIPFVTANGIDTPKLNKIYRLVRFAKGIGLKASTLVRLLDTMTPRIDDLNSLQNIEDVWKLLRGTKLLGTSADELTLPKTALPHEQLAENLGQSLEELAKLINAHSEEKLSEALDISQEELLVLFALGIKDSTVTLNDVSRVTSMDRLELLHRPIRLARTLNVNLQELKAVLTSFEFDINIITYAQILRAKEMVSLAQTLGLNLLELSNLLDHSIPKDEFVKVIGFTDNNEFNAAFVSPERLSKMGEKLGITSDKVQELFGLLGLGPTWSWNDIRKIYHLVGLSRQVGMTPEELHNFLGIIGLSLNQVNSYLRVSAIAVVQDSFSDLLGATGLSDFHAIDSFSPVYWLYRINVLASSLGISVSELSDLNVWEHDVTNVNVDFLLSILKSRYEGNQLEKELKKPNERIWRKTRGALLRYAAVEIPRSGSGSPTTIKELGELLLIDLGYSPCNMTTEIQQAIESLQTFVIRARTGEEDIPPELIEETHERMEEEWRWMRRYVLWEAAQKVFLYPESYVMPQLRDNKTPFFTEFEDELSQGEVTEALAEEAIASYIEKLHSISALRVSGTVYDPATYTLHIFARSQIGDRETYYRTFKDQKIWSPWIKLEAEINSDRVFPLIAYDRVYIFWIETEIEGKGDETKYKHKLNYCYTIGEKKWSKRKQHELTTLLSSVWDPYVGIYIADNNLIGIILGEKNDLHIIPWLIEGEVYKFHITCNDSTEKSEKLFPISGFTHIIGSGLTDFNPDRDDWQYVSGEIDWVNFAKDWSSSEALITYGWAVNPADPMGEWNSKKWGGRATVSGGLVNFLYIDGSSLRFLSANFSHAQTPHLQFSMSSNVFENIDSTFKVDDAIAIGNNSFFFCSDQHRCLMIVAHTSYDLCGTKKVEFSICQLNYGKYCQLTDKLFQEGLDALYDPEFQKADMGADFEKYDPAPAVVCTPSPKLEFHGPNKIYNWELFFHIPHLVADGLNQNRKFEVAKDWYHYIFNPYTEGSEAEWRFAPLTSSTVEQLNHYFQDPEDAAIWVEDPYSPHALARVRPGTYKKAIILAYVDNLLDWADQEFTRDTRESINRAFGYYNTALKLLNLKEIEHDESCSLILSDLTSLIRGAVPRTRVPELIEKLDKLRSSPREEIEELFEDLEEIAGSIYDEEIRADIIDEFLESFDSSASHGLRLSDAINSSEEELEEYIIRGEDIIPESPEDGLICDCIPQGWIPAESIEPPPIRLLFSSLVGCIPENPIFQNYRNHVYSNLRKIRSCRNIAGVQRILPMFEASVDPMSIVKAVGSGAGLDALNFSNAAAIGPYRFAYLIERAKALTNYVVQAGNALLLAIEKKESEELAYLRAQQELNLTKANVNLRKLGVAEAEAGQDLALEHWKRADAQETHYKNLVVPGEAYHEGRAIYHLKSSINWQKGAFALHTGAATAAAAGTLGSLILNDPKTALQLAQFLYQASAGALSTQAQMESTWASISQMQASFQRRKEEWTLQKTLATKDKDIADAQQEIALDRYYIAEQELIIAEKNAEYADQMLEFLKEKFTNKELYAWMMKTLSKLLYGFYNLAYTNARMAQATLEFERNVTGLEFISYGYWDSEKKGLLSGDQLLLDINRLDDHYVNNNARKLEITKHISLAGMAPEALIALKSNGVTTFATPMSWYDRDFPGHYQRIIKSVKVSVLALIPPAAGIKATLSTTSTSRVILDPLDPIPEPVSRIQSVALSAPSNATGLFELNYRDERYLPFEGTGVDVSWELEMPKASNRFDFNSIVDVIFSVDYTALADFEYKRQVIDALGTDAGGMLPLSVRTAFSDAWYHFSNPVWLTPPQGGGDAYEKTGTTKPYIIKLVFNRLNFPPNEENHKLERVALSFNLTDSNLRLPIKVRYESENGEVFERNNLRTGEGGYLALESGMTGLSSFGTWEIEVDRDNAPEALWAKNDDGTSKMEDKTEPGKTHHILDTDKISDMILAITYSSELEWPTES